MLRAPSTSLSEFRLEIRSSAKHPSFTRDDDTLDAIVDVKETEHLLEL